jgi:hypothetical protein
MLTSFWISPSRRRVTGIPVHFATVFLVDLLAQHATLRVLAGQLSVEVLQLLLESHQGAVAELGRLVQIAATLGVGHRVTGRLDLFLDLADLCDALLLGLPPRLETVAFLAELGQLGVDLGEALARDGVVFTRQ